MTKIKILLFCMLGVLLILGGCSSSSTSSTKSSSNQTNNSSNSSYPSMTIKLATVETDDRNTTMGANKFKDIVESESNGKIKVSVFPNLQLGSMQQQAEMTQMGSIQLTISPLSTVASFAGDLHVLEVPFLFNDEDEIWKVMDSDVGQQVLDLTNGSGLKSLGIWSGGFKEITSNKKPILGPSDLKGVKIRVIPSDVLISTYKAWGANPVSIDFSELYTSLQQGTVDGEENPLVTIDSSKLYEVQKYLTLSNHAFQFHIFMANEKWFDGLNSKTQKLLKDAEEQANKYARQVNVEQTSKYLGELKDKGMKVNELSDDAREEFKELSKPLYDSVADTDSKKKLLKSVQDAIGK